MQKFLPYRVPGEEACPQQDLAPRHVDRAAEGGRVGSGVAVDHLDLGVLRGVRCIQQPAAVATTKGQVRGEATVRSS